MKVSEHSLGTLPWIVATVLVAGIVHIVSVLLMPEVAPHDAYARFSAAARSVETTKDGVAILPRSAPGAEVAPFGDPLLAEGVCIYDLSSGLLHVRADVESDEFLAVSFHARTGRVFHALTDRSAIKGKIDIMLGDARQIEALESDEDEAPTHQVRVTSPSKHGFVLIRSLAKRQTDRDRAEQRVRAVVCETAPEPES
jgi:uncharacterized membrane protein